ncbi:MAG: gliding motility-associated C-terminal domain-containing protein [Phaeodactylibacter sp.]|uniref:gliding motility-associated C-terminal domain-containing protein n=1 Tax=Phaeodactylibacter sp. TaxID=1940289 RepID=UPI0032EFCC6D
MPFSNLGFLSVLFSSFFLLSFPSNGVVRYVNVEATGSNDGSSWADAHQRLEDAIAEASPGDTLWIAEGTYTPTLGTDRSVSFQIQKPLALYGGFQGDEVSLQERDPASFVTLLSGDIGLPGDSLDNSYRVLTIENVNAPVTLDGLSIAHALNNAPTNNLQEQSAGGILLVDAAVHAYNLQVSNNTARYGGGMAAWSGASWLAADCTFSQNRAYAFSDRCGGAAYTVDPNVSMDWLNCGFAGNWASNTSVSGGGAVAGVQQATFTQCYFSQNRSEFGPAVSGAKATFYQCAFWGHPSGQGVLFDGQYTVNNSIFWFSFSNEPSANATVTFNNCMLDVSDCPPGAACNDCLYNKNPYFIDPLEEDFRVPLCAPSVDRGSTAALPPGLENDLGGLPRILDGTPDIGPYEFLDPDPGTPGTHVINSRGDRYSRSLAGAIICANENPGPDTIRFRLGSNTPHIIPPKYNLPPVMDDSTIIDATDLYSPGEIQIDGSAGIEAENVEPGNGLRLFNNHQEVYGLDIRNFAFFGVRLFQGSAYAQIGRPGKSNVFMNNGQHIRVVGSHHNIQSNYLGCTPDGEMQTTGVNGIAIGSFSNDLPVTADLQIGGSRALGEGNIIGNCTGTAISAGANENSNTADTLLFGAVIAGNSIGWHPVLEAPMPNQTGISLFHTTFPGTPNATVVSDRIIIGGQEADHGNILAHSTGSAIFLEDDGVRASMRRNTFFCNGNGITFFEAPNFQKPPPVIQEADIFQIAGISTPGDTIEIMLNDTTGCTNGAACQGSTFLGEALTGPGGNWSLSTFPFPLYGGEQVTAIATSTYPVSSPFANCATVICPESYATFSTSLCANDSLVLHGQVFTVDHPSGQVILVDSSAIGCDSIVSVTVEFLPLPTGSFTGNYCSNETVVIGNTIFDAAQPVGSARLEGAGSNGCDSLVEVALTFLEAPTTALFNDLCPGDTLTFGNELITTAGVFLDTLTAANGCDSLVALEVELLEQALTNLEARICPGASYSFQDTVLDEAGTYSFLATAANGCDSIILLELLFFETYEATEQATLCAGDTLAFCETSITSPGTYFCELSSVQGCDSTIILAVTEAFPSGSLLDTVLCPGQTLTLAEDTFNQAGQYEVLLQTDAGCDSLLQIELSYTVTPSPSFETTPDFGGGTGSITAVPGDSSLAFSWIDGTNTLVRTSLDSGTYILVLEDTLGCISEWPVEVEAGAFKYAVPNTFTPNGDGQNDTFAPLTNTDQFEIEQFKIYNRWGQLVFSASTDVSAWDGNHKGAPQPSEVYYYQLLLLPDNGTGLPITVQGNVTLIR